ncbi:MAG: phage integrase N-terminal SAM-like domain-containing protein, partial [bacterium]|nr:phage integrase N-terminal SAM-like domain-containing protein [bacterium]
MPGAPTRPVPRRLRTEDPLRSGQPVNGTRSSGPQRPRLFDHVRDALRARHYSRSTDEAYISWTRRYILFHGKRHRDEMGAPRLMALLLYGAGLRVLEYA